MSMILLNGHSLNIKNRFVPEAMSLNLEEKNSTAVVTLGPDAPAISVGDWIKDEEDPGAGVIYRVKTTQENVDTQTRTITLEHVINSLKDRCIFGEAKPADITGNPNAKSCTASQAAAYAMARQDDWRLGGMDQNPTNPYSFNGDTVWAAMETITASMSNVQWEYDLTKHPFTLYIKNQPTGFQSEMRMSRNISTMQIQIDRSRMYTRIYPIGKDNIHIPGDFISRNEGTWGIVCKVETDQSQETPEALYAWAYQRLLRHCEPIVTVTVTGLDLSKDTGEALDKITVGRRCRIPLPEAGTTITERVTKMSWANKIAEKMKVTVTMANQQEDIATIVNRIQDEVAKGGGGRAGAKKAGEDHAWFVDTDEHVGMVAEAVAGPGADKDWSRVASIFVDGEGIHQKVTQAQGAIVEHETRIEMSEKAISLEAEKRVKEDESLLGKINVEAGKVGMVVGTNKGKNFIKAAEICIAINEDGSSQAVIEADKIHLLGETIAKKITAEYISSQIAKLTLVSVKRLSVSGTADFYKGIRSTSYGYGNNEDLMDCFVGVTKEESGGNITLKFRRANGKSAGSITFSRAVASWEMGWSSGVFTAKAKPQNQSCWTELGTGTPSWDGKTVTIPIIARNSSAPGTSVSTGKSVQATYSGDPTWSWSNYASESNSQPSGAAKGYDLDTRYTYHYIDVTVDGSSRRFVFRT